MSIKTRQFITRKTWTTYSSENFKGSGYCEEHYDRQYLIKEWSIFRIPIWKKVLDWEDVPLYVGIQLATVGSTDWRSSLSIKAQEQNDD